MDLNEILIFTRVVQSGSFTRAAQLLELPKSTVSRKVTGLEKRLGVTLLYRTTRKLKLTEIGSRYFEQCSRVLEEMDRAEALVGELQAVPQGMLRISAPLDLGTGVLSPALSGFLAAHPQIQISLLLSDELIDLVEERIDVAVRIGVLEDSSHRSRRVGAVKMSLCASPSYLKKHGSPSSPQDLKDHRCLVFVAGSEDPAWTFRNRAQRGPKQTVRIKPQASFASNNSAVVKELACSGQGIALLPRFICGEEIRDGKLRELLPEWGTSSAPIQLLVPSQKQQATKVKLLVGHLETALRGHPDLEPFLQRLVP